MRTTPSVASRFTMALAVAAATTLAACAGGDAASSWTTTVDTLESGVVRIVHTPPPAGEAPGYVIEEELRIGTMDGGGAAQFGQVKGIAVLSDGRIAVLDAQAKELRVFDANGRHLATYGGEGAGPGELSAPSGLMRAADDRLWIPDHGNDRMNVFDPSAGFVTSYPVHMLSYGFIYRGAMLDDGRIVKPSLTLVTGRRNMLRVYGPEMEMVDSIFTGPPAGPFTIDKDPPNSFYWEIGNGAAMGYMQVPFYAQAQQLFAPSGDVWTSGEGETSYRLTRATLHGDTTLFLENRRDPIPVAEPARDSAIDAIREALQERGAGTDQDWSKIPEVHAPVQQLFASDEGALWVKTASADATRHYDVYGPDGAFRRRVLTSVPFWRWLAPVIRGDQVWGVVTDEFDVQYVVRGRVREMAAGEGQN